MKYRTWLFAGLPVLLLAGWGATQLAGKKQPSQGGDYFPLKPGNRWTLQAKYATQTLDSLLTVSKAETKNGATTATVMWKLGGTSHGEVFESSPTGVRRIAANAEGTDKFDPPFPLIRYPLKSGDIWTWEGKSTSHGMTVPASAIIKVTGPENVKTPAGTFRAMHIAFDLALKVPRMDTVHTLNGYWFAPGVGPVKQSASVGKTTIEALLTDYNVK